MKTAATFVLFFILGLLNITTAQWVNITPPESDTTNFAVYTVNSDVAFISRGNTGTLLKTTNAGLNWALVPNPSTQGINKIQFLDENTGFLGGNNALFKTTNGGVSWITLTEIDGFADINFINENTGYMVSISSPPKIYRTTDGGLNYTSRTIFSHINYSGAALSILNQSIIFLLTFRPVSDSSIVFKCTNWDSAFTPVYFTKPMCYDISFIDQNTGVICGNMGALKRTSNGGIDWVNVNPGNNITFQALHLNNSLSGYVAGNSGSIFKTTNSGINWVQQNSQTSWYINDIHVLPGDSTGFAVGEFGTILKRTNGGFTFLTHESGNIPAGFALFQNYPNPFNPVTKISFALPESGITLLEIFDITGRLVSEIVNTKLSAGMHEYSFDAMDLAAGLYFCKLTFGTGGSSETAFSEVKKMLLIK